MVPVTPSTSSPGAADQAEQDEQSLDQDGVGARDAVGVHGADAGGQQDGEQAPAAHEQAGEHHPGRAGHHGQDSARGHGPGRARELGDQRDRNHQQRAARRLHEDEIAVWLLSLHQADGAAQIGAIIIFGDAEQESRPG
jgi:hypothetical protein